MDGFQGAVLGVKLPYLEGWTESRRLLASRYKEHLSDLPIQLPVEDDERRHVFHLFVALHPNRDAIRAKLETMGVQTGLHYPVPVHLQKAYAHLGHQEGDFPVSERIARECITLPLFPEMSIQQQDRVIDAFHEVLR
jgi:dTDP-4-amino-4,6-dideoxygalactose transaminase